MLIRYVRQGNGNLQHPENYGYPYFGLLKNIQSRAKSIASESLLTHIARNDIFIFCFNTSPTKILLSAVLVNQTKSIYGSERPGFYAAWNICLSAKDVHPEYHFARP